jgi:hypothetical protein
MLNPILWVPPSEPRLGRQIRERREDAKVYSPRGSVPRAVLANNGKGLGKGGTSNAKNAWAARQNTGSNDHS